MESEESISRTAGPLNHPQPEEWVEFLYEETPGPRRRQIEAHIANCPTCAGKMKSWSETLQALDRFELPVIARPAKSWMPAFRLAAAAAVMLAAGLGFAIGKRSSSSAEVEELRHSVAQMELMLQSNQTLVYSNSIFAATTAANEETLRLLADFAHSQDEKLLTDRQAVGLALTDFEARLGKVHRDLETVAVNTQTGFQQTRQNLTELVAYFPPNAPANIPTAPNHQK
jgi:hypothetical protein